jgi:uncharacterized membrane protein
MTSILIHTHGQKEEYTENLIIIIQIQYLFFGEFIIIAVFSLIHIILLIVLCVQIHIQNIHKEKKEGGGGDSETRRKISREPIRTKERQRTEGGYIVKTPVIPTQYPISNNIPYEQESKRKTKYEERPREKEYMDVPLIEEVYNAVLIKEKVPDHYI